jgi:predicted MPP superfamily phosphohydrolase
MRADLGIALAVLIFAVFNAVTIAALLRIHPRRRVAVITLAVIGNVLWLFLPILNARTDFSRLMRAIFGAPWFSWNTFAILYTGFMLILLLGWLPFRKRTTFAAFARGPSRIVLWTALIVFPIGVYQALVPLRVEQVTMTARGLPPKADGLRVALMGDLHVGLFTRPSRLHQIFVTAQSLHPDVVIIAGDLIDDDPYFVPKLLDATRALDASTPLLAVLGNHEMYGDPEGTIAALRGSRIRLLVNEGADVRGVWIAGLSDYAARAAELRPNFDRALSAMPRGDVPLVVAHQPKAFDEAIRRKLPLTLCAHTHGGQCGFRPLRWSLAGLFLPYHMGFYQRGASQLYVNTGTGFWVLPWRLGMTPEITLIELRSRRR